MTKELIKANTIEVNETNIRKFIPNADKASNTELATFLNLCSMYQLNPFKREIYFIKYGNSDPTIVTGYEAFLKRAERTGQLDGWHFEDDEVIEKESKGKDSKRDFKVTLVIYRKDWNHPFKHSVYFSEVAQKKRDGSYNSMWEKMPKFMTKKTCISQGFRMCFPDEFGGMPYTDAEMGIETADYEVLENGKNSNDSNGNGKSEPSQQDKKIEAGRLALVKRADDMKADGYLNDEEYSQTLKAIDKIQDLNMISKFNNKFDVQINAKKRVQESAEQLPF